MKKKNITKLLHNWLEAIKYKKACFSLPILISAAAAQLFPPKCLQGPANGDLQKNVFDVMLHLEAEWPSKQNILIADTILAEPGP